MSTRPGVALIVVVAAQAPCAADWSLCAEGMQVGGELRAGQST